MRFNSLTITQRKNFDITNIISSSYSSDPRTSLLQITSPTDINSGAWTGGVGATSSTCRKQHLIGVLASLTRQTSQRRYYRHKQIEVAYALYGDAKLDCVLNGNRFHHLRVPILAGATGGGGGGGVGAGYRRHFDYKQLRGEWNRFHSLRDHFGKAATGAAVDLAGGRFSCGA